MDSSEGETASEGSEEEEEGPCHATAALVAATLAACQLLPPSTRGGIYPDTRGAPG